VATAAIALIVTTELAVILGFSISYANRGHRIADLEAALCRERLAQFSHLASGVQCPDAQKILAQVLPQSWVPMTQPSPDGRAGARVVGWRSLRELSRGDDAQLARGRVRRPPWGVIGGPPAASWYRRRSPAAAASSREV